MKRKKEGRRTKWKKKEKQKERKNEKERKEGDNLSILAVVKKNSKCHYGGN